MKADRKGQRRTKNPDEEINGENGRERKKTRRDEDTWVFCSTQGHTLEKEMKCHNIHFISLDTFPSALFRMEEYLLTER